MLRTPSSSSSQSPPPHMLVVVFFLTLVLAAGLRPTTSSSSPPGTSPEPPILTFCSGQSPHFTSSSSPAVTSGELARFLDAVSAGAYGAAAHMSHNMCSYVAGTNRTLYGVAMCRPDVPVPDCAACLAAASSRLVAGRTACAAAAAVWHDSCYLRYSDDRDASVFREDEYTATVFNATRTPLPMLPYHGGKAAVRRLLVAARNSTMSSHMCRGTCRGTGQATTHTPPAAAEAPPAGGTGGEPPPVPPAVQNPPPVPPAAQNHPPPAAPAAQNPPAALPVLHHANTPPPAPPDQTQVMQQSYQRHEKTPKILIILIVTITSGLVVAGVILVLLIMWYRRKQPRVQTGHVIDGMRGENMLYDQVEEQCSTEEEDEDGKRMSCQFYSYQVLEAATNHFSSSNTLGSGGFGTVFKGTLDNGNEIAVKMLKDSKKNIHELEREISIVADLRHKNLVRFLGYCFQEGGRFLVYEYVPNNSLEKFWCKACFHQKLEWATWFNIIKGVARGLRFLHDKGIIHRDLKPHNVLVDEKFNPKIADFDLMRIYDKQKTHESTEKVAGTFGYMAPECTSGRKFLLSIKSDVYSYGVLVLEIITGHKIYTFEGQNSEGLVEYVWQHWTEKRAADVVDGELGVDGEERAARQALRCVHVALLCVQSDRARRPTMGQVIAMLSTDEALQEPSLPGYVVFRPTAASGPVWLPCLGCR